MSSSRPRLLDTLFGHAAVDGMFDDAARIQGMLDFEAALARAEARCGIVPEGACAAIGAACRAELYDLDALAEATAAAGNPAIPLIKALTAKVAESDADAAGYVHWGATSQDAIDTGMVLQLRGALDQVGTQLSALGDACASLAEQHRDTVMVGRTWMQQALPVTLGLKAAGWLDAIDRHRARLAECRARDLVLQFGGAVGTLAALGEQGTPVVAALADELGLAAPAMPWHAQRDRMAELATTLGLVTGSAGKIARDISLLMQTEVGEALEPTRPGRGGSSTMPHKRNPVACSVVLAASARVPGLVATLLGAMVQEHERGLGGWQAEWETLPEIFHLCAGALSQLAGVVAGLRVVPERMQAALEAGNGLFMAEAVTMALAPELGRQAAHGLVEQACTRAIEENRPLHATLLDDEEVSALLDADAIGRILQPDHYLGVARDFVDAVLAAHRERG